MLNNSMYFNRKNQSFWRCDLLFILLSALYAWLTLKGVVAVSANGAILDSDLQTYAQGMAGAAQPCMFASDTVLHAVTAANGIPNLERMLANVLTPGDNFAVGLLRAGALAIFLFYCGWYILGRWLFTAPSLAALLAIACGITVWIGWGTFWGITHSDPVPRVWFAAIFPFLLLLCVFAIQKPFFRPVCMFACGMTMWVHGVNALNCGAMFFMAFLAMRPAGYSARRCLNNLFLCLAAFFTPVLIFLWPTLSSGQQFGPDELATFKEIFSLRWQKDYGELWPRLRRLFSFSHPSFPLFACGLVGWALSLGLGKGRVRILCKAIPPFLVALVLVTVFCWLETELSPRFSRLPMGHELARGWRYLAPLSWLMIVAAISCVCGKTMRRLLLCAATALILFFGVDRQYECAQYALWEMTGVKLPLVDKALQEKKFAENYSEAIRNVGRLVPKGEAVFSSGEDMAVRYLAQRPLVHTFKDGYAHYYNKDLKLGKKWLAYERQIHATENGAIQAWLQSGAPWFFAETSFKDPALAYGSIVWEKNGWTLIKRNEKQSSSSF